jgi:undecaprenol kinase
MKRFFKSFTYAFAGIRTALKSELTLKLHVIAAVIAIALGVYLQLSIERWGVVILTMGFVIVAELFNTALERLGDEAAEGKQKQLVKTAKDIAAGAVLLSVITALVIGILFLIIPLIEKITA